MQMNSNTELTLAFLDRVPEAAAAELQKLPLTESAALIESVPARLSAPLLVKMIPWNAARLLEAVPHSRAAAILRQLGFSDAVTLLRLIAPDLRGDISEELPSRLGRRLMNALKYPSYQVGAWVDPEIPTLSLGDLVSDALAVLKTADAASHVFLESERHGEFCGVVSVREILRADPSARLSQLKSSRVDPIENRANLSSVAFDERWDNLIHLPVVGRRGNLLGGLTRKSLRQAVHEQHYASGNEGGSWLRELVASYAVTSLSVVQLISQSIIASRVASERGSTNEQ
jgi:magnesium transporter